MAHQPPFYASSVPFCNPILPHTCNKSLPHRACYAPGPPKTQQQQQHARALSAPAVPAKRRPRITSAPPLRSTDPSPLTRAVLERYAPSRQATTLPEKEVEVRGESPRLTTPPGRCHHHHQKGLPPLPAWDETSSRMLPSALTVGGGKERTVVIEDLAFKALPHVQKSGKAHLQQSRASPPRTNAHMGTPPGIQFPSPQFRPSPVASVSTTHHIHPPPTTPSPTTRQHRVTPPTYPMTPLHPPPAAALQRSPPLHSSPPTSAGAPQQHHQRNPAQPGRPRPPPRAAPPAPRRPPPPRRRPRCASSRRPRRPTRSRRRRRRLAAAGLLPPAGIRLRGGRRRRRRRRRRGGEGGPDELLRVAPALVVARERRRLGRRRRRRRRRDAREAGGGGEAEERVEGCVLLALREASVTSVSAWRW